MRQGYALLNLQTKQARVLYQYEAPFVPRPPALWSSDGSHLALVFRQEGVIADPTGLVVLNSQGLATETLAASPYQATWEPGGNRLAYLESGNERLLHVLTPEGNGWTDEIIEAPDYLQGFAWRPASR